MDGTRALIDAKYEERIRVKHLSMEPALQGAKTPFSFENNLVEITLPTAPPGKQNIGDPNIEAEADVWNKHGEIINVHIYFVLVTIMNLKFELPLAAAKHPNINAALYTEDETRDLDKKSDQLFVLGRRAVDYFLRVVQWKTGLGLVALDTRPDRATLFGGRLLNVSYGGTFYSPLVGRTLIAPKRHRLKPTEWNDIQVALAAAAQPPVWNEFVMSAQRRIEMGDLMAGTIDLAIAAESAIRQYPHVSMRTRKRKMSSLLTDWSKLGFPAITHLPWFLSVATLFLVRNQIMHRGGDARVQPSFCRNALSAVGNLIAALS